MNKVLIADSVSSAVSEVFDKNGIAYDTKIGLSEDELATEITEYSGLIVRSAVTVTEKSSIVQAISRLLADLGLV